MNWRLVRARGLMISVMLRRRCWMMAIGRIVMRILISLLVIMLLLGWIPVRILVLVLLLGWVCRSFFRGVLRCRGRGGMLLIARFCCCLFLGYSTQVWQR